MRLPRLKIMDEAKAVSLNKKSGKYGCFVLWEFLFAAVMWLITQAGCSFTMIIGYLMSNLFGLEGSDADSVKTAFLLLGTLSCTIPVLLWGKLISGRTPRTYGFVKKNAVKHYLIGLLVGFGMFGSALLICIVTGACEVSLNSEGLNPFLLLLIFIGFVFQGNEEEVLCRGHIFVSVTRRYSVVMGIIINSLIFGCLHLFNSGLTVLAFVNLILFGLFMSLVFLRTGNIWMVSAIHTMWNFAQGNIFGVLVSGNDFGGTILVSDPNASMSIVNGGNFGLEGGLAVTAILAVGIVAAYLCKTTQGVASQDSAKA